MTHITRYKTEGGKTRRDNNASAAGAKPAVKTGAPEANGAHGKNQPAEPAKKE